MEQHSLNWTNEPETLKKRLYMSLYLCISISHICTFEVLAVGYLGFGWAANTHDIKCPLFILNFLHFGTSSIVA